MNDQKTKIVNAYQDSFDFLGFRFQMRRSPRSGKWYPHTEPSKRSEERIKATVKRLTHRRRTPMSVPNLIDEINYAIQGWSAYFHYKHSTKVLARVKWFTEERVRKHLCIRHKVRTRTNGYKRFSTDFLYNKLYLYRIPTYAKWKRA
jgi:hypothetical protein